MFGHYLWKKIRISYEQFQGKGYKLYNYRKRGKRNMRRRFFFSPSHILNSSSRLD